MTSEVKLLGAGSAAGLAAVDITYAARGEIARTYWLDGAIQLATNPRTQNQAFRYGRNAYGTQFHIELTPAMLDVWLYYPEYRQEIVRALGEEAADRFISDRARLYPLYREHTRIMFENFLRIAGLFD